MEHAHVHDTVRYNLLSIRFAWIVILDKFMGAMAWVAQWMLASGNCASDVVLVLNTWGVKNCQF